MLQITHTAAQALDKHIPGIMVDGWSGPVNDEKECQARQQTRYHAVYTDLDGNGQNDRIATWRTTYPKRSFWQLLFGAQCPAPSTRYALQFNPPAGEHKEHGYFLPLSHHSDASFTSIYSQTWTSPLTGEELTPGAWILHEGVVKEFLGLEIAVEANMAASVHIALRTAKDTGRPRAWQFVAPADVGEFTRVASQEKVGY